MPIFAEVVRMVEDTANGKVKIRAVGKVTSQKTHNISTPTARFEPAIAASYSRAEDTYANATEPLYVD